jgi:hypothetical protein
MRLFAILLGGFALLAGCHEAPAPGRPPERQAAVAPPSSDGKPAPAPPTPAAPASESAKSDSLKSEVPVAPRSAEGAAQLVRTYFALVEAGRRAEAARLWEEAGKASEFGAELRRYRDYRAEVGPPGQMEGAADRATSRSRSGSTAG